MRLNTIISIIAFCSVLWASGVLAYNCTGLSQWKRQTYYGPDAMVQYLNVAYKNTSGLASKRDVPDAGGPWSSQGTCDASGGGGGGNLPPGAMSIYGVWHCGNSFCDWSKIRDTAPNHEFDQANHWIIDRDPTDVVGPPSVNLVVLSFLKPMDVLLGTTNGTLTNGIPVGMTREVVNYFKSRDIRVLLSMGGVTYTDSWNQALVNNPVLLAENAVKAITDLGADGLEIDWENGTPNAAQLDGLEQFIDSYNLLAEERFNNDSRTPKAPRLVLTLDLAVGNRYLQELSRRAAADWLPGGDIDYVNAMVPRGEPATSQWQEHVDGKANYAPPILPKPPAKIAVGMWLTNSNTPHANCVNFGASTQKTLSNYVQTVQPNGDGSTAGFLGYMFWAAECPSSRNVCATNCVGGMGVGATTFDIQPLDFTKLRQD